MWLNRNIKQAIDDRRVHHQQYPEALALENEFDFVNELICFFLNLYSTVNMVMKEFLY
jgi:hypothetical protein